jgi:protein-tyrosine phosphatase
MMTEPIQQTTTESRRQLLDMRENMMSNPHYADDPDYEPWLEAAGTFEPSTISEIVDGLYITARDGVNEAVIEGHFIINVTQQNELDTYYDAQVSIYPNDRTNIVRLDALVTLISGLIDSGHHVTVHCSMGMERSVLVVAYYLHKWHCMSLDEAYATIIDRRPIAVDRREWARL